MNNKFQKQFESIKSVVDSNIKTIKELIEQSRSLHEIAKQIGFIGTEEALKDIDQVKQAIDGAIKNLIAKTEELFKTYDELLSSSESEESEEIQQSEAQDASTESEQKDGNK